MENRRLVHDVALMMAQHCTELLGSRVGENEQLSFHEAFYAICHAGIECYALQADRMRQRLKPMSN
jgi:hypothetical protein